MSKITMVSNFNSTPLLIRTTVDEKTYYVRSVGIEKVIVSRDGIVDLKYGIHGLQVNGVDVTNNILVQMERLLNATGVLERVYESPSTTDSRSGALTTLLGSTLESISVLAISTLRSGRADNLNVIVVPLDRVTVASDEIELLAHDGKFLDVKEIREQFQLSPDESIELLLHMDYFNRTDVYVELVEDVDRQTIGRNGIFKLQHLKQE